MQEEEQMEALTEPPAYDEAGFALTEEELALRSLTAKLEPEQRELVLLRFGQQLKLREIAQITGGGIGLSNALLYRLYNFDFFLLGEHARFQGDELSPHFRAFSLVKNFNLWYTVKNK